MSLLSDAMEKFIVINKAIVDDGYGGTTTTYTEGATIDAALSVNTSMEALRGMQEGVTSVYTLITGKSVSLGFHDIVKRKADNQVFRVTSDGQDNKTPKTAGLDMRAVTAEKWTLPTGG